MRYYVVHCEGCGKGFRGSPLEKFCKQCKREKKNQDTRAWKKENAEKVRMYARNRRAQKRNAKGNGISAAEWKKIKKAFGNKCARCGLEKKLTMDHVVPLSEGGAHDPSNIQPLCRTCNSKKGTDDTDYRLEYRLEEVGRN